MAHSTFDLNRPPDAVRVFSEDGDAALLPSPDGVWHGNGIEVGAVVQESTGLRVTLSAPLAAVKRLHLRWRGVFDAQALRIVGDHWERGYGDLEWRGIVPERVLPWYFATSDGERTHAFGVKTGANAFCFWQIDAEGVSLWADVRSGGVGVELGPRLLDVCTVVARSGEAGETPFAALHAFCRQIGAANPRLPARPVYGHNDWYYAYGNNSAAQIRDDCKRIVSLSPTGKNRPFTVIDAGWQPDTGVSGGPWDHGNSRFPDMPGLAAEIAHTESRPGIWIRPLGTAHDSPEAWRMTRDRRCLDPTVPEVLHQVATDIARLRDWGYELIKHDFSTEDITGRWGFQMGASPTADGWRFAGGSGQTTAEVIRTLYQTIRNAAGDALVIGCNTVGHLSAGLFELSRTGDDTSGRDWERTRKMGVNTLGFRAPQNGVFHLADPDCVGVTPAIPWTLNRQWLDLIARSGQALFVSLQPDAVGAEQEKDLRAALALAAEPQPLGEPLDWLTTTCPRHWRLGGHEIRYDWAGAEGASPFGE